ncbi:mannonate dehydratase [Sporosarcina cascadiensis]|uniref:mannonate dehydratase n=1 Tax=Sporosarcina cascadiensis TaxID=2660747 RepID=UPI00129A92BB|nr:mannonate dehydratase [Sporosarcina cascadiensis]
MKMTFRWYGVNNDTIELKQIKQIPNVEGIVWALHKRPVGEVWPIEEIDEVLQHIQDNGFHGEVVESVNVHEDIKLGLDSRARYIENYKETIRNLGSRGVKVICYNFMPIFDWTRTDLFYPLEDGSTALFYDHSKITKMTPSELVEEVSKSSKLTLPGWEKEKMAQLKELFEQYENISEEDLWSNLEYFLLEILPVAEEAGIKMAIHPDDPPFSIFGLPRIMTTEKSVERLLQISPSPSNCLTLCTGSFGARSDNDVVALTEKYLKNSPFTHVRNVKHFEDGSFVETSHYTTDGSIDIAGVIKQYADQQYEGYVRPDHGRHLWDEECRAGYGLYDRALGIMYLHGLWDAYSRKRGN